MTPIPTAPTQPGRPGRTHPMTSLTDRYVTATVRGLDEAQRADVERELRATIEDMVDARLDTGTPPTGRRPNVPSSSSSATRCAWPPATAAARCTSSARRTSPSAAGS